MPSLWSKVRHGMKPYITRRESRSPGGATEAHAEPTFPQGLEVVSEGTDPVLDIVAVHGLNGHRQRTWTSRDGVHWLRDLLPRDLPNARVLCWGYDARTHDRHGVSCQSLYDHARTLVSDLCLERELSDTVTRPIVFVAHSLGGIVVKSALIHADAARQGALEKHRSVKVSTYGIIFMGTPHQGGNGVKLGRLLVNITSVFMAADDTNLHHLQRDSEWLQHQLGQYGPISGDFVTKFAYETYETPTLLGHSLMVVPKESAVVPGQADAEPIAIHADHVGMARFSSSQDPAYRTISGHLKVMAGHASANIQTRWAEQDKVATDDRCLADLRVTDPRHDRTRIESMKGGLLRDSCKWIFDHVNFKRWRHDQSCRLLWLTGEPGKGKTMLLMGAIDELTDVSPLSFFFCQSNNDRANSVTAVLRGLIYLLLIQRRFLVSHVRDKYDEKGPALFQDENSSLALLQILKDMLTDPRSAGAYLIVDAVDECRKGKEQLVHLINETASEPFMRVKWLVSSRYSPGEENASGSTVACTTLSLEQSVGDVSSAVDTYIDFKLSQLASLRHDRKLRDQVCQRIRQKANGTFLWASVVFQNLQDADARALLRVVDKMPAGIVPLYLTQIQALSRRDHQHCLRVLATAAIAYRPLHLLELGRICDLPEQVSSDTHELERLVEGCGSFLTVQDGQAYFTHDSAKEYLLQEACSTLFPAGLAEAHYDIFCRSVQGMSSALRRDVCGIGHPGISIDQASKIDLSPLGAVRYSCVYWVDHLLEVHSGSPQHEGIRRKGGPVDLFLRKSYLYWLEALSLMESISHGVTAMTKLEAEVKLDDTGLIELVRDLRRFILRNRRLIEETPLQTYASALLFSPAESLTRKLFASEEPSWITKNPVVESTWDACIQTFEGHVDVCLSAVFSRDGRLVVSGSGDNTARIWDAATGACIRTLAGEHTRGVTSVAFSHDGQSVVSGSTDRTARIWDVTTGACKQTLRHSESVESVSFSHDSRLVASASSDKTIQISDVITGVCRRVMHDETAVRSVAFSHDSQDLISASGATVKIWDVSTGECTWILDHGAAVKSALFSHDSRLIASASDQTIKVWDASTGECKRTLPSKDIWSVAFSYDDRLLASTSDKVIKIWDVASGQSIRALEGHTGAVRSIDFSSDSKLVLSTATDRTVKIWDIRVEVCSHIEDHASRVGSIAFSHDSRSFASASADETIRIWDAATGECTRTLKGHTGPVISVAFSADARLVVSTSRDTTVKIWDTVQGICIRTLEGYMGFAYTAVFSHDSRLLLLASDDNALKIWDMSSSMCKDTLKGHSRQVRSAAFSNDSRLVVSGSADKTAKVWETSTGTCIQSLEGHTSAVVLATISQNKQLVASTSEDAILKIWDIKTGACMNTRNIGIRLSHMSFDSTDSCLLSDIGPISTGPRNLGRNSQASNPGALMKYGLSSDLSWITWNRQKVLWLPPEFRPSCSGISGSTIATGCMSGRVFSITFSLNTAPVLDTSHGRHDSEHEGSHRAIGAKPVDLTFLRDLNWRIDNAILAKYEKPDWSSCLHILNSPTGEVMSVAFSPDSRVIASASGNTVQLWDANKGVLLETLRGHTDLVWSVGFSPDSRQLISSSDDRTIRFWDAAEGTLLRTLSGHFRFWSVAFSPDLRRLVLGSPDSKAVELWDSGTGRLIHMLCGHTDAVFSVAFSPNSLLAASASADKTVRLWEVRTGALKHVLRTHTNLVRSVNFSPDSRQVVSGSFDGNVRLWDADTGTPLQSMRASTAVMSVSFSPDGWMAASGSADGTVQLWDVSTGAPLAKLLGHEHQVWATAFSPDSQQVISGSMDGTVRLWETDGGIGAIRNVKQGNVRQVESLAISPDSQRVAATSGTMTAICLWEREAGVIPTILRGHTLPIHVVAFAPDSRRLASGSADKTVRLWDAATGAPKAVLRGHTGPVLSITFSLNSRRLSSASADRTVRIWDVASGVETHKLRAHSGPVSSIDFSPDSRTLSSASVDGTVRLWNAETGALLKSLPGQDPVGPVAFSSDMRWLVVGLAAGSLWLCDPRTGAQRKTLQGHKSAVTSIAISSNSRILASGSKDSTIWLWDLEGCQHLSTLRQHTGVIRSVAISPDLRRIASASDDGTVQLWEVGTGIPVRALHGYGPIFAVAFSANSEWLLSADPDGTVRLCNAATGAPVRTLRDGTDIRSLRPYGSRHYGRLFARTWAAQHVQQEKEKMDAAMRESLRLGAALGTLRHEYHQQVSSENQTDPRRNG